MARREDGQAVPGERSLVWLAERRGAGWSEAVHPTVASRGSSASDMVSSDSAEAYDSLAAGRPAQAGLPECGGAAGLQGWGWGCMFRHEPLCSAHCPHPSLGSPQPASEKHTHTHTQEGLLDFRLVWLQESSPNPGALVSPGHPAGKDWAEDSGHPGKPDKKPSEQGSYGHACYFKLPKNNNTNLSPR